MDKLSSTKSVPRTKKLGTTALENPHCRGSPIQGILLSVKEILLPQRCGWGMLNCNLKTSVYHTPSHNGSETVRLREKRNVPVPEEGSARRGQEPGLGSPALSGLLCWVPCTPKATGRGCEMLARLERQGLVPGRQAGPLPLCQEPGA
ncbi:unnamed protein product [Rangifer tarandus platyrhynchus]|uniref:Uncharacterized protein n=1 Tax=Rangifer tarandus platyrhynchus TaxID=3082113 RepID=A0ABN8ZPT7_RANTA|nr:unnamed protein product [Rangifer tarandus platyrhynchus]